MVCEHRDIDSALTQRGSENIDSLRLGTTFCQSAPFPDTWCFLSDICQVCLYLREHIRTVGI